MFLYFFDIDLIVFVIILQVPRYLYVLKNRVRYNVVLYYSQIVGISTVNANKYCIVKTQLITGITCNI